MGRGSPVEQIFSQNVDRLINGLEIRDIPEAEQDLRSALDFARLMKLRQPQPTARFQSELRARLLQELARQELEIKPAWWVKFIPRQPVWQVVSLLAVILMISGIILGIILRNGGSPPIVSVPSVTPPAVTVTTAPPTTTTTATTTAPATTTTAATTAPATTTPAATTTVPATQARALTAEASTDKSTYASGEKIVIQVNLKNSGSQPVVLTQFPPILSLMSAAGDPVWSFLAGQSGRTLAPGETATFYQVWLQTDAKGRGVAAGVYHLELEDIDLQGQGLKVTLNRPVSFEIVP